MNSEERRFTVSSNCRYATIPRLGKEKMVQWTSPFTIGITIMISNSKCTTSIIRLTYIHSPINLYIFCTPTKTRTWNNGFGDRDVTITLWTRVVVPEGLEPSLPRPQRGVLSITPKNHLNYLLRRFQTFYCSYFRFLLPPKDSNLD